MTFVTRRHPGKPRSRAKAQINREDVAMADIAPAAVMKRRIAVRTDVPALEPRALYVISMMGNPKDPVGLSRAAVMSTVTKRIAITMPHPKAPLRRVAETMHQGTTTSALRVSSAICGESLVWGELLKGRSTYVNGTIASKHGEDASDEPYEEG